MSNKNIDLDNTTSNTDFLLNIELFDFDHYYKSSGLKFNNKEEAIDNYLNSGWEKGYDPHPLFSVKHYMSTYQVNEEPLNHYLKTGWGKMHSPHPFFNPNYYLAQFKDELSVPNDENANAGELQDEEKEQNSLLKVQKYLKDQSLSPLEHYLITGWKEGKNPHPFFDETYFRNVYPEISNEINPLIVFLTDKKDANPHPLFDAKYYLTNNPDLANVDVNLAEHYLIKGYKENLKPHPLFDGAYYYQSNNDVKESGINPLIHFIEHGYKETRNPHLLFDSAYYFKQCPQLINKNINPLEHYLSVGFKTAINPHPLFDTAFYLQMNSAVEKEGINPLIDYLETGYKIPRDPNPFFDTHYYWYLDKNIKKNNINPLIHYFQNAQKHQNHNPSVVFENSHYINKYPDIVQHNLNPLAHFIQYGRFENKTVGGRIEYAINNAIGGKKDQLERDNWLNGHVCIVSHEASRTGAPLIILKVVKWLVEKYQFKCSIILLNGGEIIDDFKKYGEVYNIKDMGLSPDHLTSTIVATFLGSVFKYKPLFTIVNSATSHQVCEGLHRLGFPYYCLTHEFADPYWPQQLNNMLQAEHVFVPSNIVQNSFDRKDGIEHDYLSKISVMDG